MKTIWLGFLALGLAGGAAGQELYVFSEPASNMPARSIGAKITARYPDSKYNDYFKQRYTPELMLGINKNLMVHAAATFSDFYTPSMAWESARLYGKYRFYSADDIHRHFRLAAYAEGAYSRSPFLYGDINLAGDNSGVEGGLIATQLINKVAVSATAGVIRVFRRGVGHGGHNEHAREAINYSLSGGYLLFPRNYTNYNQTNVNVYLELLGMRGFGRRDYMLDVAPAVQVIVRSNLKLNIGYRFQAAGDMLRVGERGWVFSVERTFLEALKKRRKDESGVGSL